MNLARLWQGRSPFQIAVVLSSGSLGLGIVRELLILALLGITAQNDLLQLYLSVIFTISLMIDAMRLSCLNLFTVLTLNRILLMATLVSLPASALVGVMMYYSAGKMDIPILTVAVMGAYAHLMACLLITYRQRQDRFLAAQLINVITNFILIPGVFFLWLFSGKHTVNAIAILTSIVPFIQCILLLFLKGYSSEASQKNTMPFLSALMVFFRHFSTTIGEQLFQVVIRSAFFRYGPGYLSIFSVAVRAYSAVRFILIDSYIGSRLQGWKNEIKKADLLLERILHSNTFSFLALLLSFLVCFQHHGGLITDTIRMSGLLLLGFYFSTLVRVVYFKINHAERNPLLVMKFAGFEMVFALLAFMAAQTMQYPLLTLMWVGYIAKPFTQMLMLRKRLNEVIAV